MMYVGQQVQERHIQNVTVNSSKVLASVKQKMAVTMWPGIVPVARDNPKLCLQPALVCFLYFIVSPPLQTKTTRESGRVTSSSQFKLTAGSWLYIVHHGHVLWIEYGLTL